ncbi:MAG TPA: sodium:solute symporter family protein [Gemmatimonadota bacterium]|nr:sodium:solute symporter family protein [Gemmatimonadota bacterium]
MLDRFFAQLHWLDWTILALYFLFSLAVGLYFVRRAGSSTAEFFVSGRNLPWWLAGTSMVATSFSVDTPLLITGWVRTQGIQRNWIWWCLAIGGVLSAFVFAQLWRRAEVVTDVELTQLRYSGRPAAILRGFRALYMTLYANCLTMAWVTLAMVKVFGAVFDIGELEATLFAAAITLAYSTLSGLWGVVVTDLVQFVLAMGGAILLAVFAVDAVGGLGPMLEQLRATGQGDALSFLPSLDPAGGTAAVGGGFWGDLLVWSGTALATFLVLVTLQWWANKNADGGAVVIQRMAASKDEREAVLGTLWFQVANYALRPWPWILVALASLLLYPTLDDPEMAYPLAMVDFLPAGLLGLMLASLLAAFMSTLTSYINLSAAYLVNDLYRPFIARGRSERHYVTAGRVASLLALAIGIAISFYATSISQLFLLLLALGAGIGLVYIARWFWWRVNAWSEIAAMTASSVIGALLGMSSRWGGPEFPFASQVTINLVGSTVVWVAVTLLTPPTSMAKLTEFYRRVRPPGWWGPVREALGESAIPPASNERLRQGLWLWLLGTTFIYASLFGSGKLLLQDWGWGIKFTLLAVFSGWALARQLTRRNVARLLGSEQPAGR